MARTKGSNGQRIENVESEVQRLRKDFEKHKALYDSHLELHVKEDLQATRHEGKPLYSYADIADRHDLTVSAVQRIAIANNLTRRKKA